MDRHVRLLGLLCRVGGVPLAKQKQKTTYSVSENAEGILKCFEVDITQDQPHVHPTQICSTCYKAVNYALSKSEYTRCGGGCAEPSSWLPHDHVHEDGTTVCRVCTTIEQAAKGGRPAKKKRTTKPPARTAAAVTSTCTSTHTGTHQTRSQTTGINSESQSTCLQKLYDVATPSYAANKSLSTDGFIGCQAILQCTLCSNVLERAVEADCCRKSFCSACVWEWLASDTTCPGCNAQLSVSNLSTPNPILQGCLAELVVRCDNYAGALIGCPATVPLAQLASHVQNCENTGKQTVGPSTAVSDVLTASPSKLRGNVSDSLTSHLVKSKADAGVLQLRSRGPSQTWQRTTVAAVPSNNASARTVRRRCAELEKTSQRVAGSFAGAVVQQAATLSRLKEEERKAVLIEAGVMPKTPGTGTTLALKANLHMPWNQLRKLKVWLKDFGLYLESERVMRKQLDDLLPFTIVAEKTPFVAASGSVELHAMVTIPDLVGTVHHYLNQLEATDQLHWHDGAIPKDEVWVKIGGDHGGESFKMSFQIVNVQQCNALRHIIPFIIFAAKDTAANLCTALQPFVSEVEKLASTTWRNRSVRVLLFGDYELQTTLYGLSGSSGTHPCLHCTAMRKEIQLPGCSGAPRSLDLLCTDNAAFVGAGAKLADAKKHNNCIRPPILPVSLDNVIIPVLHLDLGIFAWIFDAMTKDCQMLDVALASSSTAVGTDSRAYTVTTEMHESLRQKQLDLQNERTAADSLQEQLEWLAIHASNLTAPQLEAATAGIQAKQHTATSTISSLQDEVKALSDQLQSRSILHGPCEASLDRTLQEYNICRQRYHGGAFIGNHIHHALQPPVVAALSNAPLIVASTTERAAPPSVLDQARVVAKRYNDLLTQFSHCRRRYSSCATMSAEDIQLFESDCATFLSTARQEVVTRKLGHVTPKLHLLECHLPDALARFRVGLGLLAEQGGESIHAEFNDLRKRHGGVVNDVDKLRTVLKAHLSSTLPQHAKLVPQRAKRKRKAN